MTAIETNKLPNGATRRTVWGKPDEIVMERLEKCVVCDNLRLDNPRPGRCCGQPHFKFSMGYSEYGQVTYREFCKLESPRFRASGMVPTIETKGNGEIALFARDRKKWTRRP